MSCFAHVVVHLLHFATRGRSIHIRATSVLDVALNDVVLVKSIYVCWFWRIKGIIMQIYMLFRYSDEFRLSSLCSWLIQRDFYGICMWRAVTSLSQHGTQSLVQCKQLVSREQGCAVWNMLVVGRQCSGPRPDQPSEGQGSPHCDNSPCLPPFFFFFWAPQHGLGEDAQVCPMRGAAVRRPVRAALHRHAEVRRHRSKGQNVRAAAPRRQHGLLADRGLLHRLRHLHCPAGLGTHEVHGLRQEEVFHREEEVVSIYISPDVSVVVSSAELTEPDLMVWTALAWLMSWVGKSCNCLCLPSLLLSSPLSLHQEACGPRLCDRVHITLFCLSHRQLWGTARCVVCHVF